MPFMRIPDLWRRMLPQGELKQGVVTLVGAATIGQAIVVISAPVITRLYSPTDVGSYSVATAVLSVLVVITCLRYEWAIPSRNPTSPRRTSSPCASLSRSA